MDQKIQFISDWLEDIYTMTALCEEYGISRKTGYKWINRYETVGIDGLKTQSRRPHHHPDRIDDTRRALLIEAKLAHQAWGPKKIVDYVRRQYPQQAWPVDSTVGEILKRAGLVKPRKRRRRMAADSQPFKTCDRPNAVWSADFKGDFALGNRQRCYPLTLSDNDSRYLLQCRGLTRTRERDVHPWFEWSFREYGLPDAMRIDNGPPFASLALGGISQLSKWWIKLGIKPERIKPGNPQQNGRHERMHRSLKAEAITPPKYSLAAQQRAFDGFVKEFNKDRSHEALQRKTPGQVYTPSHRAYPEKIRSVEYDEAHIIRQVRHNGEIKWQGQYLYVSQVLAKEPVGLRQVNEFQWQLYFSFYLLGTYDERTTKIQPCKHWHAE
jgi:transposase InsO family protein